MARVRLDIDVHFKFSAELAVRVSDLNYGNHLAHDAVLTLMQEARVMFYRSLGFKDETALDENIGQVIADAVVQYKSEAFLGDVLIVHIGVRDFNPYGFDLVYQIIKKGTDKEVARGKTGVVCFDYRTRRMARIPDSVLAKLNAI